MEMKVVACTLEACKTLVVETLVDNMDRMEQVVDIESHIEEGIVAAMDDCTIRIGSLAFGMDVIH